MNKEQFLAVLRHVITAVGSGVAVSGGVDGSIVSEVGGVVLALAALGWSLVAKSRAKS